MGYRYIIKENAYPIGTATGKKKAIEFISKLLERDKVVEERIFWQNREHLVLCSAADKVYSIEREYD